MNRCIRKFSRRIAALTQDDSLSGSDRRAEIPWQSDEICPMKHALRHWASGRFVDTMNEQELLKRLELLRTEHRDLDAAISALTEAGSTDQLQIARLKKRKLRLKDQIALIEDTLLPDIIA